MDRMPQPEQIYQHFKNKLYQIITVAEHAETGEKMVVYRALYGDFKTYIRTLDNFLSEVDHVKYPNTTQKYRFELRSSSQLQEAAIEGVAGQKEKINQEDQVKRIINIGSENNSTNENVMIDQESSTQIVETQEQSSAENANQEVSALLMQFLDAESYYKKLEVVTSNKKHLTDRLINDMAVSLDCTVDEGPIDQRIQGLIFCLQAMCRFENKRLR